MRSATGLWMVILMIFITACGSDESGSEADLRPAGGDKYYGGVFRFNEVEYFRSLYPLNITEVGGHRVTNQIYEGLVRFNQADLTIEPAIAESWEVDSQATVFTFKLRKGVRFHDDPCFEGGKGREVTAHDFKYCFTLLSTADVNNQGFWVFENRVKGASDYHQSTIDGNPLPQGVTGVQVVDDYTLRIELEKPFSSFLYILALPFTAVFPKEAVEEYGVNMRVKTVGTGPFYIKALREDEAVILSRNEDYWATDEAGNQLPYLDGVKVSFIKDRKSEMLEFRRGNLEMTYKLPLEMVDDILEGEDQLTDDYDEYVLQMKPNLTIQYYGFQHQSDLFDDINLRKAFNYAINREQIVDYTLKGTAIAGHYGAVPPALDGYDSKAIRGYVYDPGKAQEHMNKAGFPNGEGFPELILQINSGGGRNEQVAEAVQKMLQENLNINVGITKLPFAQHLENLETGKALFWRAGWIADYPDPENFLNLFYSVHVPDKLAEKSYINSVRYQSARYDSVFRMALQTVDDDQRMLLYMQADQIMMNDAAILPIYYDKDYRLLQPYVRNFPQNAMEYRNFRSVYFVPNTGS